MQYNINGLLRNCHQSNVNVFSLPNINVILFSDVESYTDIAVAPGQYMHKFKPFVEEDIKRQHFSGVELLKKGTAVLHSDHQIAYPFLQTNHNQTKQENDIKRTFVTSENPGNLQCSNAATTRKDEKGHQAVLLPEVNNSRYAIEGPLATGNPTPTRLQNKRSSLFHKETPCTDVAYCVKDEKESSISFKSTLPSPKNLPSRGNPNSNLCKLNRKEVPDLMGILPKDAKTAGLCNAFERPSVKLNNQQAFCGKHARDVITDTCVEYGGYEKCHELSSSRKKNAGSTKLTEHQNRSKIPRKLGFDLDKSSLVGEASAAARTRVYNRKTKSRKLELSPDIGCSKRDGPTVIDREKLVNKSRCLDVKTTVTDTSLNAHWRIEKVRDIYANFW